MKKHISISESCFLALMFVSLFANCQMFSNTSIAVANSWNATLVRTISVSGLPTSLGSGNMELVQVNLHMGSQADGTYNYSRYTVSLQSPAGTTITLISGNPNPASFPNASNREFLTKFRDNQYLRFPANGSGASSEPWHIGYYRTAAASAYASFTGEDPNGDWTLTITENSVSSGARFNRVDLIFGNISITDYTLFTGNDDCATPFCLRPSEIIIGTNNGFTNQANDMYNANTSGCTWNSVQNNSAWFKFVAHDTDVHITISGITSNLQILGVSSSSPNPCLSGTNSVVSGGCPHGLPNDSYLSPRYSNGSINNNQLLMSGLTPGDTYYFIVDGNGGAISPFYIEISTGAKDSCDDVLPVEMLYFHPELNRNGTVELLWATASEVNNDYFLVQHSADGVLFEPFAVVNGNGTTNTISYYNDTHYNPVSGTNYYRIKQVDFDGAYSYSKVVVVNIYESGQDFSFTYNQENSFIEITTAELDFDVQIINISGQIVYRDTNKKTISIQALPKGIYIIVVTSDTGTFKDKIVIH